MDTMRAVLVVFVVVLATLHSASTFPSQDVQDELQADQPERRYPFRPSMSQCDLIRKFLDSEDHTLTDSQVQTIITLLDRICGNATEEVRFFGFHRPPNSLTILCGRLSSFITNAAALLVPIDSNLSSANSSQLLVTALTQMCKTSRAVFGRQDEPDELLVYTPFPPPPMESQPPPPPPEGSGLPPPEGPIPPPIMVDEDMSPKPPPTGTFKPWVIQPRK